VGALHVGVTLKLQTPGLMIGKPYEAKSTEVKIPPTQDSDNKLGQLVLFGA
jgi:hypothetical protein